MNGRAATGPLWAVTSYFNPARYRNRLRNFQVFRRHLGVPLLAVELSFDGSFELRDGDADLLLRWRVGDPMWQKERLLNSAWSVLPPQCTEVAWLDCDIVFADPDWPAQARAQLQDVAVVHGFSTLRHLPPQEPTADVDPFALRTTSAQVSAIHLLRQKLRGPSHALDGVLTRADGAPTAGVAWIARREWISRVRLFDASIAGGGDTAFAAALLGRPELAVDLHAMNAAQRRHYLPWAAAARRALTGGIGVLPGDVLHLWHGALEDRQSRTRHERIAATGFDPRLHLVADGDGPWRWSDPQAEPAHCLRHYFAGRKEDGGA